MAKFICNKLGRDKSEERINKRGIKVNSKIVHGDDLIEALRKKVIEEAYEVAEAKNEEELIEELGDILEVIDAICKANNISHEQVQEKKRSKKELLGGFDAGFFVESFELEEDNPRITYFRNDPRQYKEVK